MAKVKWAAASRRRRKRVLALAKGYRSGRRRHLRKVKETVMRAKVYRTRDRKMRKREFRSLWVIRLNAAARVRGLTYSQLMAGCRRASIRVNRQQLSELAIHDEAAFDEVVVAATGKRLSPTA